MNEFQYFKRMILSCPPKQGVVIQSFDSGKGEGRGQVPVFHISTAW